MAPSNACAVGLTAASSVLPRDLGDERRGRLDLVEEPVVVRVVIGGGVRVVVDQLAELQRRYVELRLELLAGARVVAALQRVDDRLAAEVRRHPVTEDPARLVGRVR